MLKYDPDYTKGSIHLDKYNWGDDVGGRGGAHIRYKYVFMYVDTGFKLEVSTVMRTKSLESLRKQRANVRVR